MLWLVIVNSFVNFSILSCVVGLLVDEVGYQPGYECTLCITCRSMYRNDCMPNSAYNRINFGHAGCSECDLGATAGNLWLLRYCDAVAFSIT